MDPVKEPSTKDAGCVVVRTTVDTEAAAGEMARRIVEERLAACVQCTPVESTYRWKGAVETSAEYLLAAKTRSSLAPALAAFIGKHHSYETPEIVVTPILGGSEDYLAWIHSETDERAEASDA
jgi:periplasmic divalent cation tolerance protein